MLWKRIRVIYFLMAFEFSQCRNFCCRSRRPQTLDAPQKHWSLITRMPSSAIEIKKKTNLNVKFAAHSNDGSRMNETELSGDSCATWYCPKQINFRVCIPNICSATESSIPMPSRPRFFVMRKTIGQKLTWIHFCTAIFCICRRCKPDSSYFHKFSSIHYTNLFRRHSLW